MILFSPEKEVGAPNDCRAAFVGCFDDEVISVFEIYEGSPFFFGEVGEFGVAIILENNSTAEQTLYE